MKWTCSSLQWQLVALFDKYSTLCKCEDILRLMSFRWTDFLQQKLNLQSKNRIVNSSWSAHRNYKRCFKSVSNHQVLTCSHQPDFNGQNQPEDEFTIIPGDTQGCVRLHHAKWNVFTCTNPLKCTTNQAMSYNYFRLAQKNTSPGKSNNCPCTWGELPLP